MTPKRFYQHLILVCISILFMPCFIHASSIPIIPGEAGFGMNTPAGSGRHLATPQTNVYKVTNRNDSGPGSLRYGLEKVESPKTIIFEVSGTIDLDSQIWINDSYITIAGQTAPSPGITIKDHGLVINRNTHDILIQHIRIRIGDQFEQSSTVPGAADCITIDNHYSEENDWHVPYNIIIDHCSLI